MKKFKLMSLVSIVLVSILLVSTVLTSCGKKFKIGAQNGTIAYYTIGANNSKGIKATGYTSPQLAVTDLINKAIDAVLVDDQVAENLVKNNKGIKILDKSVDEGVFAFGIQKNHEEFKNTINAWIDDNKEFIEQCKKDPDALSSVSIEKYSEAYDKDNNKILVLYTSPDYPPYENIDGSNYKGIDISIAEKLANDLGLKLKIAETSFDSLIIGFTKSQAKNAICLAGLTETEDRKQHIDFSKPYVKTNQVLIVLSSNNKYNDYTQEQIQELVMGK